MVVDAMILVFWMLSFKPTFSVYSLNFIKRLFSSSLLSAIRVVSALYLRLLIFLPAILIPAFASSSLAKNQVGVLILFNFKIYYQSYGFSSSHVWMWELDCKESWAPKNWCFWTVVLEKTLESPVDGKEIQPVNPKGNQSWIVIGRTGTEAETPILWPPDAKNWFIGKDPYARKDWRQEEKGTTEDEKVGWHYQLDRHEFE